MRRAGEEIELEVSIREEAGKTAARRLRARGQVPGVVYGGGGEPVAVALEAKGLLGALPHAGRGRGIMRLRFEGKGAPRATPTVMVREVQRHPITGQVLNVDLQRISLTEMVSTTVPVALVGQPKGVSEGAVLEHLVHEVHVQCLPTNIPEYLQVDVSQLAIGAGVHVSELTAAEGVEITSSPEEVVAILTPPRKVEEAEEVVAPAPEEPEVLAQRRAREEAEGEARG